MMQKCPKLIGADLEGWRNAGNDEVELCGDWEVWVGLGLTRLMICEITLVCRTFK
jgi:hypothetical protein